MTRIMDDGAAYDIDEEVEGEKVWTSILVVMETEPSDALTYICVAENMVGTAQEMAQLTVHGTCSYLKLSCVHEIPPSPSPTSCP